MVFLAGLFVGVLVMRLLGDRDIADIVKSIEDTKTQKRIVYKGDIYYRNK